MINAKLERDYSGIPIADVLMAVNTAAIFRLGVVEMKSEQPIWANPPLEFIKGFMIHLLRSEIVAHSEEMTGVKAITQSFGKFSRVNNLMQMLKAVAQVCALSVYGFQKDDLFASGHLLEQYVETVAQHLQAFSCAGVKVAAHVLTM